VNIFRFTSRNTAKQISFSRSKLVSANLLLWCIPALSWAQSADLVANNQGPTTSAAGAPFTYVVKLSNNGLSAADGATFLDSLPVGVTGVSATCTAATGGAVCPSGANLVASNTEISGTIPTFPNQGAVELSITGNYGVPSPTSVNSKITITPPAGVTETNEITNTSTVNTTLITDAKLFVNKTQSTSGGVTTYTITLKNDGNAAADGAKFGDYLGSSVSSNNAGYRANVSANFVSCIESSGAICPANENFNSFTGSANNYYKYLFNTTVPKLPAGGSLTVVYQATVTPSAQCGLTTANLNNTATITPPNGITNQFGTATSIASVSVPGTVDCPATPAWNYDLTKTQTLVDGTPIAQGANYAYGTPIRYTVTVVNNGTTDADGAFLRDWTQASSQAAYRAKLQASLISCTAENNAECPQNANFPAINRGGSSNTTSNGDLFNLAIPKFPVGGRITVVYEAVLSESTVCGRSAENFNNYASMQPPIGNAGFTGKQFGPVSVRAAATPACPDIQVTKTQSTTTPQPGVPLEYVVTITNNGPGTADGSAWYDYMSGSGAAAALKGKIEYVSCTGAAGAECPALSQFSDWSSQTLGTSNYLVKSGTTIPKLPNNGVITLRYRVTLEELNASSCTNPSGSINNYTYVTPPNSVNSKSASVSMPVVCADVGITKTVDPIFVKAGQPLTYTVTVTNAGLGATTNVVFSDPLPSIFEYESAACEMVKESVPALPHPRTECGPSVDYNPATRMLTSTIKSLGQLGEVKFTIKGKAGVIPGTYKNEAEAILPPGVFDPIMRTNKTDVNVQIANTQSAITVKKLVAGVSAAGLPVDMSFTGTVTCGVQAPQPWSIKVLAGASTGTSAPLTFYDTEVCTVTEDTPPTAPQGYDWEGTPVIVNSDVVLGPETPREVSVTNTLKRQTAGLVLTKLFTGADTAVQKVTGKFSFAIDCGVDGKFDTAVDITDGASSSVTVDALPAGASCQISETASAAAPAGYVWDTPLYETNPLVVPEKGASGTFKVTNVLKVSSPTNVEQVPALGGPLLAALAALLAVLGAWFVRRQTVRFV
jgi:uncharacterized repeat protein (TIGR01451 family)